MFSPSLTDFLDNAYHVDPYVFIRHFGNWLQTKLACEGRLDERERRLLDTPGEVFLGHLESGLNAVKSYKMVVLTCLLELAGNSWRVDDIAVGFRGYFLGHRDRLFDYDDLASSADPEHFPLSKVKAKLLQMPLKYLSNTDTDWFVLDRKEGTFALKPDMVPYWEDSFYRELVEDRVQFGLVRYFSRKGRVAEVPYDEALLKTGFSVRRNFAFVFYSENPLKPGEGRNLKIRINGDTYGVFFRRSENGKEYGITYDLESRVVQALRQTLGKRLKRGETAFTLRASGKNELILALPQKGPDLRGILVEIPYAAKTESGFTAQFRRILSEDPGGRAWTLHFDKSGYTGAMEIEIENPGRFSAWTARRYDDPSRFPARIKAAATALFAEGFRGGFQVTAGPREVRIVRGMGTGKS